ncbi:MAG: valine--tRNA ligase [Kiritimatiellae bacterium]|nr:valine--tRNA ligase [Kiritimatiellia bacterium]
MEKHYDPKIVEDKWYSTWLERKAFSGDATADGESYSIMIPPPNVTGILHMGHALNITIQDILVRWHRMRGFNTIWVPGTDHAGIATQNVVERALKKEGKTREDLGREDFIKKVWDWREEYGGTIIRQLKKLGASCDWERERFTMDEGLSEAVADVFVKLYEKDLIYRGNYIINWCPRCHTALSDEESEHVDSNGKMYYIRYAVKGEDNHIVVATTRPETLLGDVAVAINPDDERYSDLGDKTVLLPILGRELVVVKDDYVDPEFGTGIVKITPAHDPNDFEMGNRHDLTPINVMNGNGTMNEDAGPYAGMDRFECRKKILADLEEAGMIEKIDDHKNSIGHCYRCDTVVEPRLSPQWFVKMAPLAEPALEAVTSGKITFTPPRWGNVYQKWMEGIRDWCISRQIWWGHRIPIFYCDKCDNEWASKGQPDKCPSCSSTDIRQDEDVLDTWFSSWLWPFSALGWPEETDDLAKYYPTNDLVTGSEIIFFWVARMVMAGIEFVDDIPFDRVYIHGTVRDDKGRKMSKSLGNSIDPLTIIDKFSTDALRFSLMMITATGQDIYLSDDKFEIGRNFATKLWNACRFIQMQDADGKVVVNGDLALPDTVIENLSPDDKHILASLNVAVAECASNLERRRFNDAAHVLYEFLWHKFCDWYVEYSKVVFYGDDETRRAQVLQVMHHVLERSLRLLHPIMPFVTEELWHVMGYGTDDQLIMLAAWPEPLADDEMVAAGIDSDSTVYVDEKHELVRVGRNLRADYGISPAQKINYLIKPNSAESAAILKDDKDSLKLFLRAEEIVVDSELVPGKAMPSGLCNLGALYMPLEGLIDIEAETKRLAGQLEKLSQDVQRVNGKLNNHAFVSKAPSHVIDRQVALKNEILEKIQKLETLIETLGE